MNYLKVRALVWAAGQLGMYDYEDQVMVKDGNLTTVVEWEQPFVNFTADRRISVRIGKGAVLVFVCVTEIRIRGVLLMFTMVCDVIGAVAEFMVRVLRSRIAVEIPDGA
jgi:hypothetical protein